MRKQKLTVFLRQFNCELVQHIPGVALQSAKQGPITIHDDESKFVVISQERSEGFCVELFINKKSVEQKKKS